MPPKKAKSAFPWRALLVLGIVAIIAAGWGIYSRAADESALAQKTDEQAIPIVSVADAAPAAAGEELVLPGTVQAFNEASLYARTSGYLKTWLVDIGTKVKAGQVLAEIDTPDVDAQFEQVKADLATAEANEKLSRSTAARWKALRATDSVSQQEADEKASDEAAKKAIVAAAQANLDRLKQLEDFKKVVAPFDGVVTARNTDIGALISAGTTGPRELFRVADISKLRIYVQVPQNYAGTVVPGMTADLHFAEHPGKSYVAKLVGTSQSLDVAARSLMVQLEFDNEAHELLAGGYAEVHLKSANPTQTVRVLSSALLFRADGLHVAVLGPNDRAVLKTVKLGRDFGNNVEITSGLSPGDKVITNPPDSLLDGERVRVAANPAPAKSS